MWLASLGLTAPSKILDFVTDVTMRRIKVGRLGVARG
jgi:hypothetical protein